MKISPKKNLHVIIYFLLISLTVVCLKVKSGYRFFPDHDLAFNLLLLILCRSFIPKFKSERSSDNFFIAGRELFNRAKGLIVKELQLFKYVNCNDCIC